MAEYIDEEQDNQINTYSFNIDEDYDNDITNTNIQSNDKSNTNKLIFSLCSFLIKVIITYFKK